MPPVRSALRGLGCAPQRRGLGDHVCDVVPGELDEVLAEPARGAHGDPGNVRTIDLEEEDVARVLFVEVPADDPELLLVVVRARILGLLAAALDGLVHEPADVVIVQRQRFAIGLPDLLARAGRALDGEALDDEPGVRLEEDDRAHAAIVEVGADRAQDLFPVLPGTSLVDPHRLSQAVPSGPVRPVYRRPEAAATEPVLRWAAPAGPASSRARRPATRASLMIRAVLARTEAPSVMAAIRASSHGVRSGPCTPAASASRVARSTAARATDSGSATSAGTGTHTR